MTMRKTPDWWLEIVTNPYPVESPETSTTYRYGRRVMASPSFIQGRLTNISPIEHALSDWRGNSEASTLTVDAVDTDGEIRTIAEAMGTTAFAKAETSLKLLSETGRAAGLEPRIIHRGYLSQAPIPRPQRHARIDATDVVGSTFFRLDPSAVLQKVFITREWMDAAGIAGTPTDKIGKPLNIVIGEHSDAGTLNANGESAEKGMIPADDLGNRVFTSSHVVDTTSTTVTVIPPPVLTAEVIGTPGGRTCHYQITMLVDGGETVGSNVATVTNAPEPMDLNNYVKLTWVPPAGWEDVYAARAIAYRVCGRDANPPVHYLDLMNNGSTFVNPETEYHDGEQSGRTDFDVEKDPGPPAVGTATVVLTVAGDPTTVTDSDEWGVMALMLGYGRMLSLYGSDRAEGRPPARMLLSVDDPELMTPESANWPHADPWVELTDELGTTIRVTLFYAKGVLLKHHREGTVTFAANMCGVTDTGDDTGDPISEAGEAYKWVLNELLLKNGGEGYRTGNFWPLEEYRDGTPILSTPTIDAFQVATAGFLGGSGGLGYQCHLCLTEPTTLEQFHQWFNTSFTCYTGHLDNGQLGVWVIDSSADPSTGRHYRQHIELGVSLAEPNIAEEEVENRIRFHFDWDPDGQQWRGDVETIEDADSQRLYGIRDASTTFLELRCTRDQATARDAMARRLFHHKVAPIYQPLTTSLLGIEQGIGTLLRITHHDGVGVAGYVNRPFFVTRKRIELNSPNPRVTLVARDVYRALNPGTGVMDDGTVMDFVMQ